MYMYVYIYIYIYMYIYIYIHMYTYFPLETSSCRSSTSSCPSVSWAGARGIFLSTKDLSLILIRNCPFLE